jgi:adenosylcobinamide-GDP ribazoletransferase
VAGHILGRWSILPLVRCLDYASGAQGSGKPFVGAVTKRRLLAASLFTVLVLLLVVPGQAAALIVLTLALCATSGWYFRRKIGGITGDTLGASNQLIETSTYLLLAASAS